MRHFLYKARISKMDCRNWKFFGFKKLFDIRKGKRLTKADMVDGDIPYIGATDSNNGVTARISNDEYLHSANTISVSYNGSIAEAFYQTKDFWATDDVNVLYPKFELNKEIALFLTTIINREKYRFNYGRKWDKESMELSQIKLPALKTANGVYEPDWIWIENYVKNDLVKKLPKRAKDVWQKRYDPKPLSQKKVIFNTNDWKCFEIGTLFDVELTKGDIKAERIEKGVIPLVSSGETNNGIVKFVNEEGDGIAETFPSNTITFDMFCHAFYQPKSYYAVGHGRVNILKPKFKMNKYNAIFIASLLDKEAYRFSYGRAVYSSVAQKVHLLLPAVKIAPNKYEPDWQFMEDYIKSLPYSSCL